MRRIHSMNSLTRIIILAAAILVGSWVVASAIKSSNRYVPVMFGTDLTLLDTSTGSLYGLTDSSLTPWLTKDSKHEGKVWGRWIPSISGGAK